MSAGGRVLAPAAAEGEALLLEMMREFYRVEHLRYDEGVARACLAELRESPALGRVFLIREGEAPAGYLVLTFGYSLEFHGRDALVDELYVREAHRGRGLGTAALREAEEVCRAEGIRALHLEVDHANTRAQELYRRAGYRGHGRHLLTRWLEE